MIWFTDIIFDLDYFWVPDDYKPTLALFISFLVFFKDISKPRCLHPNSLSSLLPDTFHSPCIWVVSTSVTLKSSHTDTRASWLTSQVLFKPAPSLHFHCYQPNLSRQHLSSWLFCYSSTISTPHIHSCFYPVNSLPHHPQILSKPKFDQRLLLKKNKHFKSVPVFQSLKITNTKECFTLPVGSHRVSPLAAHLTIPFPWLSFLQFWLLSVSWLGHTCFYLCCFASVSSLPS